MKIKTEAVMWQEKTLGELVAAGEYEIRNNLRQPLSSKERTQMQGEYPYYGAAGPIDSINQYRFEGLHLLIAEDGTVFSSGNSPMLQLVSGKFWVSNHAHVIRGKTDEATMRLYYFLRNVNVAPYITGAVQPKLSKENLLRISFLYPHGEVEKEEVASIPISLDNKVELLKKENETLRQIVQALFREWFIEFNFPNEEGEPYKASGGKMIESELGCIPADWIVVTLGGIAEVIDCLHSRKPEQVLDDTGRILLQLENITDNGLLDLSQKYFISEEDYQKWISRIEATEGDCVITNVGRVGAVSRIPMGVKAALGRNMTAVRCKPDYDYPYFLITFLTSELYKKEVYKNTDSGTILDALNVRNISKLEVAIPKNPMLIELVDEYAASLWQKMEANVVHSNQLSTIRDILLPRLMTGEIRLGI